jgi:hypothetical protein
MVRTKNGCVAARRKVPTISVPPGFAGPSPNLNKYYRNYQNQGSSVMPQ